MTDSLSSSPRPESSCSTTNRRKPLSRSLRAKPALERIFSIWVWTDSGLQAFRGGIRWSFILSYGTCFQCDGCVANLSPTPDCLDSAQYQSTVELLGR